MTTATIIVIAIGLIIIIVSFMLTGKGEETRQKYGTVYAPCRSDADYTREYIKEYDESPHHARK